MKLLISAYACAPNQGSEHGSAWSWTTGANRLGHELTVLVSPAHRDAIAAATRDDATLRAIRFVFPEVGFWPLQQGKEPKWERTYNLLWQRAALRTARALHHEIGFDAVHHLTWAGIRAPTFMGSLGIPLIMGPLGGGETSPKSLRDRFPLRGRVLEVIRDISNATITFNPIVRKGFRDAAVIFARTGDTWNLLGPALRAKTRVMMELGVSTAQIGQPRKPRLGPPRLLYAGRLLYWKGAHIAVETMARLVERLPDAHLTIVGRGPEEQRLRDDVAQRDLARNISFVPWMPQDEFLRLHDDHDMLLFPSLHDSAGWVVLESLCKGTPVACLDLGGPKEIVTPQSGIIAGTDGLDTAQVAKQLADQLNEVFTSRGRLAELSAGAIVRAHDFLLSDQITRLYESAWQVIAHSAQNAATSSSVAVGLSSSRRTKLEAARRDGQTPLTERLPSHRVDPRQSWRPGP